MREIIRVPIESTISLPVVKLIDEPGSEIFCSHYGLIGHYHKRLILFGPDFNGQLRPSPASEVKLAMAFMRGAEKTQTASVDSYWLKSIIEVTTGEYLGNGSLILACHKLRIGLRKRGYERCEIMISRRWLRLRREEWRAGGRKT